MGMKEKTKPSFQGKPFGFLGGSFGKAFLEEYLGRIKSDYDYAPALDVLSYGQGYVKGSNSFAVVLTNKILREEKLRTATQADLEKVLRVETLYLDKIYEDTALVLRSEEDKYPKNTSLAKHLTKQVRGRGVELSPENPVMIPLTGLELEKADNHYGLTFKLREDAEIYKAHILNEKGQFSSGDVDEKTGLPRKIGNSGDRTLYIRDSGLSRLTFYHGFDLNSNLRYLGTSAVNGRIVVVDDGKKIEKESNFPRYSE